MAGCLPLEEPLAGVPFDSVSTMGGGVYGGNTNTIAEIKPQRRETCSGQAGNLRDKNLHVHEVNILHGGTLHAHRVSISKSHTMYAQPLVDSAVKHT